jgi:hypothetical protein
MSVSFSCDRNDAIFFEILSFESHSFTHHFQLCCSLSTLKIFNCLSFTPHSSLVIPQSSHILFHLLTLHPIPMHSPIFPYSLFSSLLLFSIVITPRFTPHFHLWPYHFSLLPYPLALVLYRISVSLCYIFLIFV